jgi:hypothetical protein
MDNLNVNSILNIIKYNTTFLRHTYYQLNGRDAIEDAHGENEPHVQAGFLEHALEQLFLQTFLER